MLHQPQPVYEMTFDQHRRQSIPDAQQQQLLLPGTPQAEAYRGHELEVLAYTATQQYFDLAREESELDVWRRNANGPPRVAQPAVINDSQPQPQLYLGNLVPHTAAHEANSSVSPALSPWTAIDLSNQQQHMMSQSHPHHHHGAGSHYYAATSPTSPQPNQYTFDPIYHTDSRGNYPSSTSSNDPTMTQEEADLKRLRNTAASARFRAKKKKREQSLERAAHEKKTRLSALESRIRDLEAENRWLKDLIMERNDVRSTVARYEAELGRNELHDRGENDESKSNTMNRGRGSGEVGRGDGNGMGVG